MESQEAIIKSLILSANMLLEMDVSSDEENETIMFDNYDTDSNTHNSSTANVVAMQIPKWSGDEYKMYLKLSAETFEFLYQLIGSRLRRVCYGMPMVEAHLQLMFALHKLTSLKTYSDACEMFNMKKSTGYSCTKRVTTALRNLAPAFIKWPSPAVAKKISESFQEISSFPGIIGDLGQYRFNVMDIEKDNNSGILFQAICDHTRKFTHCHVSSANITSPHEWLNNYLGDAAMFPNNSHLISTSPYPLHEHLMVPYDEETDIQKNFNKKLHSASIIRECFGNLFGRFESLQRGLPLKEQTIRDHVVACCVLHNICELKGDKYTGAKVEIEKVIHGSAPCCLQAKMKRDAIALKLPND